MSPLATILPTPRRLGAIALVAVVYFLAAAFGLSLATLARQVTPVWPPTGIAIAALLLLGRSVWPGIAIGAFAINAITGPLPAALGIAAGNTLEAIIGAELLHRFVGFRCAMDRPRDILGLAVCSALISTLFSATLGVLSLCLSSVEPWSHFGSLWWTWWVGDAMGSLVVAPPLLIGATWLRGGEKPERLRESTFFLAAVAVVSCFQLGGVLGSPLELKYLIIPLFVWSALRLGQLTTAAGLTVYAGFIFCWILTAQVAKTDEFNTRMLQMQTFLGALFVGSLTLGAVSTQRWRIALERDMLLDSEKAARAESERAARQKDEFVANLAHELRTPLTGLLAWAQVLMRPGREPAVVNEGLSSVVRCAHSLDRMMEELLDVTRAASGKMRLQLQPMNVAEVIENVVEMLRPVAVAKKVALQVSSLDEVMVFGDVHRLQQVLYNLLSNAVKFTPALGNVDVRLTREQGSALITVQDTGMGIKSELLPHVFDRFRQGDALSMRKFGGLGLGLAIVKHIVQLHGGTVTAESRGEGTGATFSVRIPESTEALAGRSPTTPMDLVHLNGVQILIVDDDLEICESLRRILSDFGAEVLTAHSAEQAMDLISSRTHLLLSDIGLPCRDGYQFIQDIRRHPDLVVRRIPAIAVTAFTRPEDRLRALTAGFGAHVGKPINVGELLAAIVGMLRPGKSSDAAGSAVGVGRVAVDAS